MATKKKGPLFIQGQMVTGSFSGLLEHVGHELECVTYGDPPENVAIECLDCGCVVVDFNRDEGDL